MFEICVHSLQSLRQTHLRSKLAKPKVKSRAVSSIHKG